MNTSFQRPADRDGGREDEVVSTCKSWTNADSHLIAVYICISAAPSTKGPGRRREGAGEGEGEEGTGEGAGQGKGQR